MITRPASTAAVGLSNTQVSVGRARHVERFRHLDGCECLLPCWMPLPGLHTGARVEDLRRLTSADVVQLDGVWCFHLHERESRTGYRTVMRHVPVRCNLLRLGWLVYVESRRAAGGSAWLFPDLSTNQYEKRGAVFSNRFNAYAASFSSRDAGKI